VAVPQLDAGDEPGNLGELRRRSGSQPRLEVQPLGDRRGNRNIRSQAVREQGRESLSETRPWQPLILPEGGGGTNDATELMK
jgi:hypothetical protein